MGLKKTLIKNTSYNLIGYVYLLLASLFSIPVTLANLGQHNYGILVLFTSFLPIMTALDFGLSTASIRYLSLPKTSVKYKKTIWQNSFFLFILSGLAIFLISLVLLSLFFKSWSAFQGLKTTTFYLLSLLISLTFLFDHINAHLLTLPQANHRFDIYNLRTIFVGTGNTLGTAIISFVFPNLIYILIFRFFFYVIAFLSLLGYARLFFGNFCWPKYNPKSAKKLLTFGVRHFLGKVSNQFSHQFSKYSLGSLLPASSIVAFAIPQNIILKVAGAISQATLAFFPISTSLIDKKGIGKLKKLVIISQVLIFILGLLQVLVIKFFGYNILLLWLKEPSLVGSAYPVLKVLSWFFFFTILTPLPTAVLNSLNYPQIPSFFAILTSIFSVALIILLTPKMGILGPALALVISSSITVPLYLLTFVWKIRSYWPQN